MRPLSLQYTGNTKALPEIFSRIPVCDFLCSEDGRCKQLPTSYQKYWSQRTHSVWEWINNAPSKPAAAHLVPTFGSDQKKKKKKLPSEAQVGHSFCSSPVCEGLFLSEKFTQQPPQDVSHFWWLKGTCRVWRRKPLIYFHHFSLADSDLREKEQARSLICLLGMPGSHGSPDRGHLFRSQPLQTRTERGCLKGCAPTLLWRTAR